MIYYQILTKTSSTASLGLGDKKHDKMHFEMVFQPPEVVDRVVSGAEVSVQPQQILLLCSRLQMQPG